LRKTGSLKRYDRKNSEIRRPVITPDFSTGAYGSLLLEMGNTRILCAASCDRDVPDHASAKGNGWLTLLPYSTSPRTKREFLKRDGRSVEIQRLIGRSLRQAIDLSGIPGYSITIDCDVIRADGGTRTTAITAGFMALRLAVKRMLSEGLIGSDPIRENVAAISAGMVEGELLLDLDYHEDSRADVDMNIVMDGKGRLIEIQGTAEGAPFSIDDMNGMISMARAGIDELIELQNSI
jgi:ribonuclease PH